MTAGPGPACMLSPAVLQLITHRASRPFRLIIANSHRKINIGRANL